jgi:two-component system nitrogen regulation sensor histidine kinase NtrY
MGFEKRLAERRQAVSFRRKLLLVFALTVFLSVAAVAWIVAVYTRRTFERSEQERTLALVRQFQREFDRRGEDVVRRVEAIAASEPANRMALALSRGSPDYGTYLNEAKATADSQRLDFLEFVDSQGTIISSAQAPAEFGYKEPSLNFPKPPSKDPYLKKEDMPEGPVLGVFATQAVTVADRTLYVIGGRRLDKGFLASLELPAGMRALFYQNLAPAFSPQMFVDPSGSLQQPEKLAALIQTVLQKNTEMGEIVHWSGNRADDERVHAIPLRGPEGEVLGVLLVAVARRPYVELERRIASVALLVGGVGILLAVLLSSWAAGRVTRPVEELAAAAREVAAGNLNTNVGVRSSDELGQLAEAFNKMTRELLEQRERLVQAERVAAWRELARRLAHELKNPLFPLQLTVENLLRAREQDPTMFEEIFRESASTLLTEISNLKAIIARFSEFSKMPQPSFQSVQLNEVIREVMRLYQAQLSSHERPPIDYDLDLDQDLPEIAGDPDLLRRAISNLVLNAMDAMPQGGKITLRTRSQGNRVALDISDTGTGLTREECERLFTPYYTSKQHGTGLGLAIVQSVISDHDGRIAVDSAPGKGTTFCIELPRNLDKLTASASLAQSVSTGPAV